MKLVDSHYCQVLYNILDDGNDNLQLIHSDHNLVEGNRITLARHNLWSILCGNFNVIRDNYFHNAIQKAGQVTDCEGVPSDAVESYDDTHRNVIEGNEFALTGNSGDASPYAGIQFAGQETIIRRNVFHHTIGPALDLTLYSAEAEINTNNRIAHNVFARSDFAGVSVARGATLEDNVFKNNVLSGSRFVANDTRWRWYTEVLDGEPVQLLTSRLDGLLFERNVFWGGAPDLIHVIAEGHRTDDPNPPPRSLATLGAHRPGRLRREPGDRPPLRRPGGRLPAGGREPAGRRRHLPHLHHRRRLRDEHHGGRRPLVPRRPGRPRGSRETSSSSRGAPTARGSSGWTSPRGCSSSTGCCSGARAPASPWPTRATPPTSAPSRWTTVSCRCPRSSASDGDTAAWVFDSAVLAPDTTFELRGGPIERLGAGMLELDCLVDDLTEPRVEAAMLPPDTGSQLYLVLAHGCGGDSGLGRDSSGTPRVDAGPTCP